ncbi:MAG TPA: nuclear transport factor 2 family protein [Cytophagales bacterium]|jgi:hypothetical protein
MQPLELVQGWYQTRDTSLLHPKLEWQVLDYWPAGGVYHSRQAVVDAFFPQLLSHFSHYETVPEHYYPSGETVLVKGVYAGTGKRTGKAFRSDFVHSWSVQDGRLIGFRQVADTAAVRDIL